jgi:hypothetical protein
MYININIIYRARRVRIDLALLQCINKECGKERKEGGKKNESRSFSCGKGAPLYYCLLIFLSKIRVYFIMKKILSFV